jgi:hypothetical protein
MIGRWSNWKPFPDPYHGEHIDAPIGAGIYEVCHIASGEQVAFGYGANVAQALANVVRPSPARRLFRRFTRPRFLGSELEYRTCAAGSLAEARTVAEQLRGQRQALFRRFSPTLRQ